MQTMETAKVKTQETFEEWTAKIKEQPNDVKLWSGTAGSALVGAFAVTAVAKGMISVIGTLASPPVALTVGAIGGSVWGWNYMQSRSVATDLAKETNAADSLSEEESIINTATENTVVPAAAPVLEQVDTAEPVIAPPAAEFVATVAEPTTPSRDKFEKINGIGPIYAGRLHKAGIHTFAQLAALTPERILEIIETAGSSAPVHPESWITEARQFTKGG